MKHPFRTAGIALGLTIAGVAVPGTAHAGDVFVRCPDTGGVALEISNGYLDVFVNGTLATNHVSLPDGTKIVRVPVTAGDYHIEWWGYPTSNGVRVDGPNVRWNFADISITGLECDDEVPATTAAATTVPDIAESTVVATTVPSATTVPAGSTETTGPVTTPAAAIDQGRGELPATGQDNTVLLVAAGALLALGTTLVLVRRRPA